MSSPRPRGLLALLALILSASVAMAIEEPAYRSVERAGAFELREYAPYLIAETRVARERKVAEIEQLAGVDAERLAAEGGTTLGSAARQEAAS